MSIRSRTLVLLLSLSASGLPAQQAGAMSHEHPTAKSGLDAELAEHFKGIALTDMQIRQLTEIKAKHHTAMEELRRAAADSTAPALKAELQKHMAAEHDEFMSLLNEAQRKVFAENMKGHHATSARASRMPERMDHDMDRMTKAPVKPVEPRRP